MMIAKVREVVDLISHELGVMGNKFPIIRKEQSAKKPAYPFAAYKLLSVSGNRNNRTEVVNPDPTKITDRYSKINTAVVSLSFYISENAQGNASPPIDVIYDLAQKAIDFLQVTGKDKFEIINVLVELIDPTITDRTTYIEPIYEYQVGFDFRVKAVVNLDNTLDAVDLDGTVLGVEMEVV